MKGFRTLAVNAGLVGVVAVLHFAAGVDWTTYVNPDVSVVLIAAINMLLRMVTNTPIGVTGK